MRLPRSAKLVLCSILVLSAWWLWLHGPATEPYQGVPTPAVSASTSVPAVANSPVDGPNNGTPARASLHFPGAHLIAERTLPVGPNGITTRQQLLATQGQYPMVRVVEEQQGNGQTSRFAMVADHVVVRLRPDKTEQNLNEWAKVSGLSVQLRVADTAYYLLKLPDADLRAFDRWVEHLAQTVGSPIEHVQPDYLRFATSVPNDTRFAEQWALHNTGQTGGTPDADVDAPEAWDISRGSTSVVVAVIDTGVDLTHPELAPNLWQNTAEVAGDGLDNDLNGYPDDVNGWDFLSNNKTPTDSEGHGTHCAGVIGAVGNNALGVSGICPIVRLMPLKAIASDGSIAESTEVAALSYARTKGAQICSMSFGGPGPVSTMERDAVAAAMSAGMLLVVAAGNEATNIDAHPNYPASFSYNNIIAVAASGHGDARAAFSNYGSSAVDLAAPGVGILSTLPGATYGYESGTSMSTPLVAGACALMKASQPTLDYAAIKSAILNACDPIAALKGQVKTGGRLNVARALKIGAGPFVEVTKSTVADGKSLGANGNSDTIINSGEDITLTVTVKNSGPATATAVTTTANITNGNTSVAVIKGSKSWGNIGAGASLSNSTAPFVLRIATGITTSTLFTVHLAHSDLAGHTWSDDVNLTIAGTNVVTGRISTLTGDKSLSGAALNYTGPISGKAVTTSNGRYSVKLPDGTYTFIATSNGYQVSEPRVITIPPTPGDVNFQLGRALLAVTPASISVTQPEEGVTTKPLTVTNKGDLPLTFTVENNSLGNAINTAYLTKPSYGDVFHSAAATTYPPLPYQEGFEGALSLSPARYYEAWTEDDGYYIYYYKIDFFVGSYSIASNTAAVGTHSLYYKEQLGAGFDNGMQKLFPDGTQPRYMSFWMRPGSSTATNGCFSLEKGMYDESRRHWTWTPVIDVKAEAGGHFSSNAFIGNRAIDSYAAKQWYLIELRNIDWATQTYDFWVNGTLVQAGIPISYAFNNQATRLHLYNDIGEGEAWWDEIRVLDHDEAWASAAPVMQTLAPGASTTVDVTASAKNQRPGTYKARVDLRSNDPSKPLTSVPVTMTVTAHPNTAPVAITQTVTTPEETPITITLAGSDAESDPLDATILTLPTKGALVLPDQATEQRITTAQLPLSLRAQGGRVIYVPPPNGAGDAFASFTFSVADYRLKSATATVKINVTNKDEPPVAADDFVSIATAAVQSKMNILGNDVSPDGRKLVISQLSAPQLGSVVINSDSTLRYTPAPGFTFGEDVFSYAVSDTAGRTATALVHIMIGPLAGGDWPTWGGNNARTNYRPGKLYGKAPEEAWNRNSVDGAFSPAIIHRGRVIATRVLTTNNTSSSTVMAMDSATGIVLWSRTLPGTNVFSSPACYGDQVFVARAGTAGAEAGELRCLSLNDGGDVWTVPTSFVILASNSTTELAVNNASVFVKGQAPLGTQAIEVFDRISGVKRFSTGGAPDYFSQSIWPCVDGNDLWDLRNSTLSIWEAGTGRRLMSGLVEGAGDAQVISTANGAVCVCEWAATQWLGMGRYQPSPLGGNVNFNSHSIRPIIVGSTAILPDFPAAVVDFKTGRVLRPVNTPSPVNKGIALDDTWVMSDIWATTSYVINSASGKLITSLPAAGTWASANGMLVCSSAGRITAYRAPVAEASLVVARSQRVTTTEDVPVTIRLSTSTLHGSTQFFIKQLPAKGTLYQTLDGATPGASILSIDTAITNGDGRVIYRPGADESGAGYASFGFMASDGTSSSAVADVTIDVTNLPDPPRPVDDLVYAEPGETLSNIHPLTNDVEVDGEPLQIAAIIQPESGGTATLVNSSTISFTSDADTDGRLIDVGYIVRDSSGSEATGQVHVSVGGTDPATWSQDGATAAHTSYSSCTIGMGQLREVWRTTFPSGMDSRLAIGQQKVFVSIGRTSDGWPNELVALNLRNGGEEWRYTEGAANSLSPPTYHQGKVYLTLGGGVGSGYDRNLAALNATSGAITWETTNVSYALSSQSPVVVDDGIYLSGSYYATGDLLGHELNDGRQRFSARPDSAVNTVYPSSWHGRLFVAYNSPNGTVFQERSNSLGMPVWSRTMNSIDSSLVRISKNVAIVQSGNAPQAIDLTSGTVSWSQPTGTPAVQAVSPSHAYWAEHSNGVQIKAASLSNGAVEQTVSFSGTNVTSEYTLAVTRDALLVTLSDLTLRLCSLQTGQQVSSIAIPYTLNGIAVAEGYVLLVNSNSSTIACYAVPPATNAAPVAQAQTVTAEEDTPTAITLSATDPESDAISFVIRSLPSSGHLFQTMDGVSKAAAITHVPTSITNSAGKLIYEGDKNQSGTGIGSFTFTAHDSYAGSASTSVTVHVSPVNDPVVAIPDRYDKVILSRQKNGVLIYDLASSVLTQTITPGADVLSTALVGHEMLLGLADGTIRAYQNQVPSMPPITSTTAASTRRSVTQLAAANPPEFRILSCQATLDGQSLTLVWPTIPGHGYVVQCSSDLVVWTDVTGVIAGTGASLSFSVPRPASAVCFLRVRLDDAK